MNWLSPLDRTAERAAAPAGAAGWRESGIVKTPLTTIKRAGESVSRNRSNYSGFSAVSGVANRGKTGLFQVPPSTLLRLPRVGGRTDRYRRISSQVLRPART